MAPGHPEHSGIAQTTWFEGSEKSPERALRQMTARSRFVELAPPCNFIENLNSMTNTVRVYHLTDLLVFESTTVG